METILYFAYGSNMSTPRLKERVPSAKAIAVMRLTQHRLKFHKKSIDRSAKCDVEYTNDNNDIVYGVLFEIATNDKPGLDKCEGLGSGYDEKTVSVYAQDGRKYEVVTYYATNIDQNLKPYAWYKEHVVRGAREHGLPADYVKRIEAVEAISDPDRARHMRELSIYC